MRNHPALAARMLLLALAAALSTLTLAGCGAVGVDRLIGGGPIRSEAEAVAALEALPYVLDPIRIHEVSFGRADQVYDGVHGAVPADLADEARRKRERPAWAVDFTAPLLPGCDVDPCLPVLSDSQVVFDAETGEILYSTSTEHVAPRGPKAGAGFDGPTAASGDPGRLGLGVVGVVAAAEATVELGGGGGFDG